MSDVILPIPDIPEGLKDSSQRGVLIPFVGAGVSRLAGCPTWAELADGALKACIEANKFTYGQLAQIRHLSPRVKLSIARGLETQHNLQIDYHSLINPQGGYEQNEAGHRLYRGLGKLGTTFVTTNYDSWLDIDIPDAPAPIVSPGTEDTTASMPARRKSIHKVADFTPANLNQPRSVFHLHGSLADPAGMIMTTRDYITHYANDRAGGDAQSENRTLTFLSHLFQEKTVLFVGYGLDDLEILEYVIQKGRTAGSRVASQARHYMLQGYFSHEIELMRSLSQYYMQTNIQLIPFLLDHKEWWQLVEIVEKFSELMPSTGLLNIQKQKEMEAMLA
jgi:hypothetical protein